MREFRWMVPAAMGCLLAACGGDGSTGTPGTGMPYEFVAPVLGSTRNYSETIVDNSNNTIDISWTAAVTAVNSDGSASELQTPDNPTAIVNGTNYAVTMEQQNYNNSGQELSYSYEDAQGSTIDCTFDPHGSGPNFPLRVGQTWQLARRGDHVLG